MELNDITKIDELKNLIYKLTREKELSEREREIIDKIVEEKDYGGLLTSKDN
jgi:hypothetical protein